MLFTLSSIFSVSPIFLYFSSDNLTSPYINWKRTKPLDGTNGPFKSAPEIEFVVINVKSMMLRGVYFVILAIWQNYVKELFEIAQISPLKGLHEA